MALHFSGNQYEQAYKPQLLRNWELPKKYNAKPCSRKGRTQIISNDRGHLLPGVPRSNESPWGNYIGTWHLPRKIDKKTVEALNSRFARTVKKSTCSKEQPLKVLYKADPEKIEQQDAEDDKIAEECGQNIQEQIEQKTEREAKAPPRFCPIHGYAGI